MIGNQKILLKPGQLITGRKKLSKQTGVSEMKCFRILKCYENEHQIEQQKTNKFSIITIKNWHRYQATEQQNAQQMNNTCTTDEQQMNTYNKDKKEKKDNNIIRQVVNYLNLKANKNFRPDSKIAVKNITARLNEKYTIDDFKKVIDIKCSHWLETPKGEKDMSIYLSPDTLFGNKFEKYLNQNANREALRKADKCEADWNKIKEKREPTEPVEKPTKEQKTAQKVEFYKTMINSKSPKSEEYRKLLKELE